MISRLLPASTASFTGAVAGEGKKKSEPMNRNIRMLKKGQRILLVGRKIRVLRVDET
jgi:hypothetical protein